VFDALNKMTQSILTVTSPNQATWDLAEEITQHGHPKSGYASMYDSIFHAIAIKSGGVFITADHKHYAKTKQLGHIKMFKGWESIFISD
jgi:predicted nucleic acid-binding protein